MFVVAAAEINRRETEKVVFIGGDFSLMARDINLPNPFITANQELGNQKMELLWKYGDEGFMCSRAEEDEVSFKMLST